MNYVICSRTNYTEGVDYAEAISMARDAIGMAAIVMQEESIDIPSPTPIENMNKKRKQIS